MANATLTWTKSPTPAVDQYTIHWTNNGVDAGTATVASDPDSDDTGYSASILDLNPGGVLNPGDVVGASITADDTVAGLSSSPVVPSDVTILPEPPPGAPEPPENVALAQS